jgi:hypothetical protein
MDYMYGTVYKGGYGLQVPYCPQGRHGHQDTMDLTVIIVITVKTKVIILKDLTDTLELDTETKLLGSRIR